MSKTSSKTFFSRPFRSSLLSRAGLLLVAAGLLAGIGWAYQVAVLDGGTAPDSVDSSRLIVLGSDATFSEAGTLRATLVSGSVSVGEHEARVLSDRNCAPDEEGISHCLNEIELDGEVLTIQHHHRMNEVPCLRPGETVTVMDDSTYEERRRS